ncbi:MAG: TIGR02453 family protein [Gemmatimonadota bacterium]
MTWHVYMVRCADGSLYTGITTDVRARLAKHNFGRGAAYTRSRAPVILVYEERAAGRSAALRREWALKQLQKSEKESLVLRSKKERLATDGGDFTGFRPAARTFFRRLARNNNRDWFEVHRAIYETEIKAPLAALVEDMDVRLARLAPEIIGDPRRSVFRIHRDVRFSKDKSPYKTNAGCWFHHRDAGRIVGESEGGGAGFYFHLAGAECLVAGGIWMPPRVTLARIRAAIVDDPRGFSRTMGPAFRRRFGALSEERMLKRLPRGFDPGDPAEPWLRYQSFTASRTLKNDEVLGARLPAILLRDFTALLPFVRWINLALGYAPADRR